MSRLIATQILYQYSFFEKSKPLIEIKRDIIENYALSEHENPSSYQEKIDGEFLDNLIDGIIMAQGLEEEIKPLLKNKLESLDEVMQKILLLAALELKYMQNIEPSIVMAEYVDIAAGFFDEKKVAFVNGVVQNLAKKLRNL